MSNEYFDRERLAGYDRDVLDNACVGVVGSGALGNNVAQCLALAGVQELRFIDFDHVELSNLTRAPLFAQLRNRGLSHRTNKAKELALASLQLSYAAAPRVRYAPKKIEALGLGALQDCDAVASAVDSMGVRAKLAEWTALLGIPMVEAGFSGLRGNVSAYANQSPDEPCYACLNPHAAPDGISCQTYAAAVVAEGRMPATQTMAAVTGALVSEAVIRFLHKDYRLSGRVITTDAETWRTTTLSIARDSACRRAHRRIGTIKKVSVAVSEPLAKVFEALPELCEPEIWLPDAYVIAMPCSQCGARVRVAKPQWGISGAPQCVKCGEVASENPGSIEWATTVKPDSPLASLACQRLGLAALSIFEVFDHASNSSHWVQLAGCLDDLYVTRCRVENGASPRNREQHEVMDPIAGEDEFRVIA